MHAWAHACTLACTHMDRRTDYTRMHKHAAHRPCANLDMASMHALASRPMPCMRA